MTITPDTLVGLEALRKEHLDSDLIAMIAERYDLTVSAAMRLYYSSRLSEQVSNGSYGIEQLDARYLIEDLEQYEPQLFDRVSADLTDGA